MKYTSDSYSMQDDDQSSVDNRNNRNRKGAALQRVKRERKEMQEFRVGKNHYVNDAD